MQRHFARITHTHTMVVVNPSSRCPRCMDNTQREGALDLTFVLIPALLWDYLVRFGIM
jgi:hypothetical protein